MSDRGPTLYIAGPMTGYPEFNYPAFRQAEKALWDAGYRILNPVDAESFNPTPGMPQRWEWYMRHTIRMLTQAEGVATLPGWYKSRGARIEVNLAHALVMPVKQVREWVAC